ncbi:MAG: hypothetical protein M1837_004240 [Sclerophora amabilis]|nr:MAG: hypothetical protein M1837_004240 [Sclerophora amabilis]
MDSARESVASDQSFVADELASPTETAARNSSQTSQSSVELHAQENTGAGADFQAPLPVNHTSQAAFAQHGLTSAFGQSLFAPPSIEDGDPLQSDTKLTTFRRPNRDDRKILKDGVDAAAAVYDPEVPHHATQANGAGSSHTLSAQFMPDLKWWYDIPNREIPRQELRFTTSEPQSLRGKVRFLNEDGALLNPPQVEHAHSHEAPSRQDLARLASQLKLQPMGTSTTNPTRTNPKNPGSQTLAPSPFPRPEADSYPTISAGDAPPGRFERPSDDPFDSWFARTGSQPLPGLSGFDFWGKERAAYAPILPPRRNILDLMPSQDPSSSNLDNTRRIGEEQNTSPAMNEPHPCHQMDFSTHFRLQAAVGQSSAGPEMSMPAMPASMYGGHAPSVGEWTPIVTINRPKTPPSDPSLSAMVGGIPLSTFYGSKSHAGSELRSSASTISEVGPSVSGSASVSDLPLRDHGLNESNKGLLKPPGFSGRRSRKAHKSPMSLPEPDHSQLNSGQGPHEAVIVNTPAEVVEQQSSSRSLRKRVEGGEELEETQAAAWTLFISLNPQFYSLPSHVRPPISAETLFRS